MSAPFPRLCAPLRAILLLALLSLPGQALAANGDCGILFELYRSCHGNGAKADNSQTCQESSLEAMTRTLAKTARKSPQSAQALAQLVCGTGCDDAVSRREPATRQEFAEAFCE
jgi:hypothetical protein